MSQQDLLTAVDAKKYFGFEFTSELYKLPKESQIKVINDFTIYVLRSCSSYKRSNRLK